MYIEYFNIITNGAPGGSLFLTISFTLIISGLIYLRFRKTWVKMVKILPFFVLISLVGVIVNKSITSKDYKSLKKILINKEHSVVEGKVEDFISMDEFNPESFSVNGVDFFYRDDKTNSAFNEVALYGGPMKEGLEVRIFYYENSIIGLWIRE